MADQIETVFAAPLFSLGTVGITDSAMQALTEGSRDEAKVARALRGILNRHRVGDWGDIDSQDVKANKAALKYGNRIMSAYTLFGVKLWIITDAAWTDNPRVRE